MNNKVKLLMVGPPECGKTALTNFLSEAGEVGGEEYRPTKGCRIVEFEVPNVTVSSMTTKAEVELWDVSGDRRYENCWPAIQRGCNGAIFVYSPGREDHSRYLDTLYTHFVEQQGLRETQCVVFCHYKPGFKGKGAKLSSSFNQIPKLDTQLEEESGSVRRDFNNFVSSVLGHMSAVAEMQENSILM
ncbi:intraflagellar transport protein 22 homolog [Homarus americanus]|uniref:intraflagellar transport protein 22 homolog n=1 Tax=Homarus americanus TaxID=6706 RepID=UPI001C44208D|nr:intraflagellar transport protein 22 homolog [Homarus americanus]XP_042219363.1 intraflagellar transport protein 22 homolog [Homarus americanus]XP_042219368.1 intraflagellar transport protein 22 homolog [Homarus americanus]